MNRLAALVRRWVDKPIPERRENPREGCAIPAYLFDDQGIASSATILDRSEGGVRVSCDEPGRHDSARYLLRLDTGAAYRVRHTWCSSLLAGYQFRGRVDLAIGPQDHAVRAIRTAWAEHRAAILDRGDHSPRGGDRLDAED